MLPKRYAPTISLLFMATFMVTIMTFVITAANTGFDSYFYQRWGNSYLVAWPIAFITLLVIKRPVGALTALICRLD
jgi:hypothetical protein